ncbi:SDR family NAD(P)-dependent oxidoreductase [Shinella sp.]|uniref:SDR family NAD(P)-dependent oxidoreductase n=1 Tax=Shinella sp. TaxID=1870904 RepID=UPI0039E43A4B
MFNFSSKSLLLHGASGGIGCAIAQLFANCGASVFLVDREETPLTQLANEIGNAARVCWMAADVTRAEEVAAATQAAIAAFGKIDYLVNSAGLYTGAAVASMCDSEWRRAIDVNLDSVFFTCRAAVSVLADGGAVVNIASLSGHRGDRDHAHYAAAKAGVLGFSKTLALELAPRVRVNAISPGVIETPMAMKQIAGERDRILNATPLRRLGVPTDIANAVAFLCSDASAFITGEVLHVNGGYYIAG